MEGFGLKHGAAHTGIGAMMMAKFLGETSRE
jgi:hypothetical protein